MPIDHPTATFALFAYNQERYIRDAVAAALAQSYSPLQVILSDDGSTDATFAIMQAMAAAYSGPHDVVLNRNARNAGIGPHVNRVMELATGDWVIAAAGDDISLPERTAALMRAVRRDPRRVLSVWSGAQYMTHDGVLLDEYVRSDERRHTEREMVFNTRVVMGCTHAWHREVFRLFGPLHEQVWFEDNAISFRSYLAGEIAYVDQILVRYRKTPGSATNYDLSIGERASRDRLRQRRVHALTGVHQRLHDLATFRRLRSAEMARQRRLRRLLLCELLKQQVVLHCFGGRPVGSGVRALFGRSRPA